jgi:hypothetical protein
MDQAALATVERLVAAGGGRADRRLRRAVRGGPGHQAAAPARRHRELRPHGDQPQRRPACTAGDRRARGTSVHRRVRHRHDPHQLRRRAAQTTGAVGQGDRVRAGGPQLVRPGDPRGVPGRPVDPVVRAPRHHPAPAGHDAGGARRRAVPGRRRPAGAGLGALLRGTAAAIGALFGLLFAPQILVGLLPSTWSDHIYGYLPAPAGIAITNLRPDPTSLAPWTGFGVFCLYTAVLLALAAWRLRRRDT